MNWLENILNKITPKVSSEATTKRTFTSEQFRSLVMKFHKEYSYDNSENINEFTLNTNGQFFTNIFIGKEYEHNDLYGKTKSKIHFIHLSDQRIKLNTFEYIMGSKQERVLFKKTLNERLGIALKHLNEIELN
jgi:hypothetical protein